MFIWASNLYTVINFTYKTKPADTSVAEWINADAGAGASIESGNQKWKPNCADLQKDAIVKNIKNSVKVFNLKKKIL